jgi:MFS family permease
MAAQSSGFRTFVVIWIGQFASLVGTNLSGFALGVYIYELTGSATKLGFIFALAILPAILASPFTGALVDRWGSRRALIVGNVGAMIVTMVLALLLATDTFALWNGYLVVAATSVLWALEVPAFASLVPHLVAKRHLGRANGMRMFATAASDVLAPVAAGFLLLAVDIYGIVIIDFLSFGLAITTLLLVRIPDTRAEAAKERTGGVRAMLVEFSEGWRYVAARRGLLALLLFLGAVNFSAGFVDLLITPLVLAFDSAGGLGTVLSIGGVGMIITSVVVSTWGGPRRRVRGMLGFSLVLAVATIVGSMRPSLLLVAAAAFVFMGVLGIIITTNQSIWQTKVEPHLLGRVMALLNMVATFPQVVAYTVAGTTAERVFEPLVGRDEVRSGLVPLIGDGPGRGAALLMMVMGLLIAVWVAVFAMNSRLRHLEDELPDVISEPGEAQPEPAVARA